ncbi:zinc finger protein 665-like isoform X2 [Eurosta solidaginis]|uniref:zinc finger protein 665-like isoform X2 n=1 Tax=Eurosta solidaginis TaxID=178769 RepID=UPI003530D705
MDTSDLHIDYLCRTCMIKLEAFASEGSTEPQHQSIFETIEECDELRIADLLSSTIPQIVDVQLSDELPKKICCKCLHQLIRVYRFQKLCVQSDHKMREMVSKKWDDLNMAMMEAEIGDEVLPNGTDPCPLSSCQPKCTAHNSYLAEIGTALEGRQQAVDSESAQLSTAEHLLRNEPLLDYCEHSQGELSEFIKNDPIEDDEENTEFSDIMQAQGELNEFIKNEPVEDDEENTEYSDTIHSTTFVPKAEFTTEEQKVTVPYTNIRDKNEQYQYPCDMCGKHFKTKSVLNRHKRSHSGEKPHKCDICEMRFIQAQNLSHHMRTHTGEKPCKCKYCDRCFTTKNLLNEHLRVHLGDNIHRCESCPLAFRLVSELRLHSPTHKDEDPETRERNMAALREEEDRLKVNRYKNIRNKNCQYPCDICGKHFKTTWHLNRHERNHSGEKPHKCDFCEKRFAEAAQLRGHMRTHTGEKPYKCKYCERCFATKGVLNRHLRVNHLGDNIYRCEFCPLAFRLASELLLHSTTHKDEDPETRERNMAALREDEAKSKFSRYKNMREKNYQFPCDICGKRFKTTWHLNRHERSHSGEKPHKCDFCEKRFAEASKLRQHTRTHTGEKPYKCKYCGRSVASKSILNKHLRVHLGDNVHRCKFCPLAFRFASELRLHSATHTDEDPETRERNMAALREEEAKFKVNRDKNIRDKNEQYQYPCDICSKHFKATWDKKQHKRIHSNEKPYKCDFCEKRFVRATPLSHHMRTHTGEKPCKCKYCGRCFTTKKLLNRYLRVHLGDNTYRCKFCPLAFRFALELRLHSTTHRNENPEARERNMKALMGIEAKLKQQALKRKVLT